MRRKDFNIPKSKIAAITIKKQIMADGRETFNFYAQKLYGDNHGFSSPSQETITETKKDFLRHCEYLLKSWQGWDGIVQRKGDTITRDNLFFLSEMPELTFADIAKFLLPEGQKTILEAIQ